MLKLLSHTPELTPVMCYVGMYVHVSYVPDDLCTDPWNF